MLLQDTEGSSCSSSLGDRPRMVKLSTAALSGRGYDDHVMVKLFDLQGSGQGQLQGPYADQRGMVKLFDLS